MRSLALLALASLALAQTFVVPNHGFALNAKDYIFDFGKVKLVRGEGQYPYVLRTLQALQGESGSCTFGWWRGLLKADVAQAAGTTGRGVRVLVIDTGVDENVIEEVFGRGVNWYLNAAYQVHKSECQKFVNYNNVTLCVYATGKLDEYNVYYAVPVNDTTDLAGHGTAVAAALLSVAPDVTLYVAKIASYALLVDDAGRVLEAIPTVDPGALAYALSRATLGPDGARSSDDPQVVNLSLGAVPPATGPFPDAIDGLIFYYLYTLPIKEFSGREAFVAAAGNDGLNLADAPALIDYTIGVAALMYKDGSFEPTSFSNSGIGVDFSSLGAGLYLPVPKYSYLASVIQDPCAKTVGNATFLRLDGTSFAAPLVSGVAALWIQRTGASGTEAVKEVLKEHAYQPFSLLGGWNPKSGWGVPLAEGDPSVPALPLAAIFSVKRKKRAALAALALAGLTLAASVKELGEATFLGLWGSWTVLNAFEGLDLFTSALVGLINALVTVVLLIISWILAGELLRLLRGQ